MHDQPVQDIYDYRQLDPNLPPDLPCQVDTDGIRRRWSQIRQQNSLRSLSHHG